MVVKLHVHIKQRTNVTNLDPGTTYSFIVVAVIEAGEVVAS